MPLPHILLISLGGTITMTRSAAGGITPTLTAAELAAAVPGLDAVARIETASPMTMPSASLAIDDVLKVAALADARLADEVDGVVVIQGTDTIEETAFLLDLVVGSSKPVVVTGAMRGPQAAGADGPANLLAATLVAASPEALGLGTLVVLNDEIHAARLVQKSHTALPSAFASPSAGPLGLVAEGRPRFHLRPPPRPPGASSSKAWARAMCRRRSRPWSARSPHRCRSSSPAGLQAARRSARPTAFPDRRSTCSVVARCPPARSRR